MKQLTGLAALCQAQELRLRHATTCVLQCGFRGSSKIDSKGLEIFSGP